MSLAEPSDVSAWADDGGIGGGPMSPTSPTITSSEDAKVKEVLFSDIGITAMLNRLKQSIASAKEFALFLKKRSTLAEEHAVGLKKLCKTSQDNLERSDHLGGSFSKAYNEMMSIHERMADNGAQFASSLQQMHEDLIELATMAEKSRKGWKVNGLAAEQRVVEVETAMRKSKVKYDTLVEEYERVRTGDASGQKGGKMFGFKGPKSAAQHEEDLLRKVQAAEQDYQTKVQTAQSERQELVTKTRPETITALQDVARKCDAGVTLQLQKFSSFNEKLLLSNGLCISPLARKPGDAHSLREIMAAIDSEKDLKEHLLSHHARLPQRTGESRLERVPVLESSHRTHPLALNPVSAQSNSQPPPATASTAGGRPTSGQGGDTAASSATLGSRASHGHGSLLGQNSTAAQPQHERNFSGNILPSVSNNHGNIRGSSNNGTGIDNYGGPSHQTQNQQHSGPWSSQCQPPAGPSNAGPPQLGVLSFQATSQPLPPPPPPEGGRQSPPGYGVGGYGMPSNAAPHANVPSGPAQARTQSPPRHPRPVFGVNLNILYERDGLAVPMVVHQCIQAVNLFGLSVEGIYRLSGSVPHVNRLKSMFDINSQQGSLDFRNPENFFHDVNSVAGLLKQFFRDLPEPLMTKAHYAGFVEAAKNDDDIVRRDSLHALINSLPDPNYATLRALTLHLHRVVENATVNRMTYQNLAIVFGPTLMGTAASSNISEAGWQVRVIDTILQNTYQIFDDD